MQGEYTQYGKDFAKFLVGDYDPRGWRSQWRIEFERRMQEEREKKAERFQQ